MGVSLAVPYFDLKRQYKLLAPRLEEEILATARSGAYILSSKVAEFEKAFAAYFKVPYAIGVGSGTDALLLSLKSLGIGKGDEVILPSFTFSATAFAVIHAGAIPVFAEVDESSFTLSPEAFKKAITAKTKAVLPVHLYGQAADMTRITSIARKRGLKIVEDTCQSHGASHRGRKAGTFGDAGCFSFYPTKNLGAFGDGGMILTKNKALAEKMIRFRNLGRKDMRESHSCVGFTSRLDALQAAVLNVKLAHLDSFNQNRRRVAKRYLTGLKKTPLILPREAEGNEHVYHLFVVRVPGGRRDALQKHLAARSIGSMIHYPVPVHLQPAVKPYAKRSGDLKFTRKLCSEILSLPIFPEMRAEEADAVSLAINKFYGV